MARIARMARRNPRIKADLSVDPDDAGRLRALMMQQPLKILAETPWFWSGPGVFETRFANGDSGALTSLASELVDWRLMRYLQTRSVSYDQVNDPHMAEVAEDTAPAPTPPTRSLEPWTEYPREKIDPYFGTTSNPGPWNCGNVVIENARAMVLLVTMDKTSMSVGGHYIASFANPTRFVWQTQTSTRRDSKHGRIIIREEPDWTVDLFVRKSALSHIARWTSAALTLS